MPQRCATPSSSTLASATMVMPWWWAMKVTTGVNASAPFCRDAVKSSASMKPHGSRGASASIAAKFCRARCGAICVASAVA